MAKFAAVALVACLVLAGCGGPLDESATTDAETTANATRAIAAPVPENPTTDGTERRETEATTRSTGTDEAGPDATGEIEASSGTVGVESAVGTDAVARDGTADTATASTAGPATVGNVTAGNATAGNTTAGNATTARSYDRNMPYEVRLSNTGTVSRDITVVVSAANDSAPAFEASVRLGPNETREFDFTVAFAGEYEARVAVEGTVTTRTWDVDGRDPARALSVHVSPDGRVYVGFLDI
ncbi:hypothetical protein [Halorussus lipolyticus]|uniref:hypothetical protein n=1 Tax=Halorussus lipolyticus TaxID=3034024 RepID=UPI0023E7A223|nr:hypothetical protein [Halorussus sp. DT80]